MQGFLTNAPIQEPVREASRIVSSMSLEWEQIVIDARDPVALGRWWSVALGWIVVSDDPGEFEIRPQADRLPGLIFEPVSEGKRGKNRLHLDLRPDDQRAEVERLVALGASRVDIGQGDVSWVVLGDPEGNEFCVLRDVEAVNRRSGGDHRSGQSLASR